MSGQRLALLLRGEYRDVLPEWLGAVAAAGKRAREEHLPDLLALGHAQAEFRQAILPVLGRRGLWLAEQNPDWAWVAGGTDESVWDTGDRPARRQFVAALRGSDPARARELVAAAWADEAPEDRAAFLGYFEVGLGMADEPFLEAALDDSRREVRRVAADLLARLPGSQLSGRMAGRLEALLSFTAERRGALIAPLARRASIEATLPEQCAKDLQRDGVERKPPSGWGEKAWWLAQMIGAVLPEHWLGAWQTTPEDLIAAAAHNEWRAALFAGWRQAALRHGDARWAAALLTAHLEKVTDIEPTGLLALLPAEQREALVHRALGAPSGGQELALQLLDECRHPWSEALTRTVLAQVQRRSAKTEWLWRESIRRFALRMAPGLVEEADTVLSAVAAKAEGWGRAADDCLLLLRFRHDMLEEIAP